MLGIVLIVKGWGFGQGSRRERGGEEGQCPETASHSQHALRKGCGFTSEVQLPSLETAGL